MHVSRLSAPAGNRMSLLCDIPHYSMQTICLHYWFVEREYIVINYVDYTYVRVMRFSSIAVVLGLSVCLHGSSEEWNPDRYTRYTLPLIVLYMRISAIHMRYTDYEIYTVWDSQPFPILYWTILRWSWVVLKVWGGGLLCGHTTRWQTEVLVEW